MTAKFLYTPRFGQSNIGKFVILKLVNRLTYLTTLIRPGLLLLSFDHPDRVRIIASIFGADSYQLVPATSVEVEQV